MVVRRLLTLVPLVWLVVTLTFVVVQAAPGSYADTIDNPRLSPETRAAIRAHYGVDEPVFEQYLRWLGAVATGDLGSSFMYKEPVTRVLARALPPTAPAGGDRSRHHPVARPRAGGGVGETPLRLGRPRHHASQPRTLRRAVVLARRRADPGFQPPSRLVARRRTCIRWAPPISERLASLARPPPPPGPAGDLPRAGGRRRNRPLPPRDAARCPLLALHARGPRARSARMASAVGPRPAARHCCRW